MRQVTVFLFILPLFLPYQHWTDLNHTIHQSGTPEVGGTRQQLFSRPNIFLIFFYYLIENPLQIIFFKYSRNGNILTGNFWTMFIFTVLKIYFKAAKRFLFIFPLSLPFVYSLYIFLYIFFVFHLVSWYSHML